MVKLEERQGNSDLLKFKVKDVMTKNPISVDKDMLVAKAYQLQV